MRKLLTIGVAAMSFSFLAQAETGYRGHTPIWEPYDGAEIKFDVLRKGKPFGKHIVSFAETPNGELEVTTDVDLKVSIGPFTAFKYQLDAREVWRGGRLVALEGKTNDDGEASFVEADLQGEALQVSGSEFKGEVSEDIIPSSHWNIDQMLASKMLSTEDGSLLAMSVTPQGRETLKIAGQAIEANRYLLDSDIDIDLWYDDAGRWLKLAFQARGQDITYQLSELY